MSDINRRQFLIASSLAALGGTVANSQSASQRVLIAGAGLAGLSAAYQLAKVGYQVTVIEARTRHGGRVFTLRDQFADGLYVETGGEVAGEHTAENSPGMEGALESADRVVAEIKGA